MSEELQSFVLREARLLDERRFAEWLALFAEDGVYWAPTQANQESPDSALSIFHESRALLEVRMARLARPDAHAQAPVPRSVRHVSAIETALGSAGFDHVVRSSLILGEWRAGETRWFAARVLHRLRRERGELRIVLKRVELISSEAPQRALAVPF